VQAAIATVVALTVRGALERARVLVERIELPPDACFPGWLRTGWALACALLQLVGDEDPHAERLDALLEEEPLRPEQTRLQRCMHLIRFTAALIADDVTRARESLQTWEARRHKRQMPITAQFVGELARAWLALREAHSGAALAYSRFATELASRAAEPIAPLLRFLVSMTQAYALWQDGNIEAARTLGVTIRQEAQAQGGRVLAGYAFMHEALIQHTVGDVGKLRDALAASLQSARRERQRVVPPFWSPAALSELCLDALEYNVEKPVAISLIHRRDLRAPTGRSTADWPWAVKASTFGTFGLQFDGVHEEVSGKAQRKVLELLKAIIAYGGRSVDVPLLASMIWPEANGDAAQSSFDITLHRLRKLLRSGDSVLVADRKVSLNASHIWVDAIEFSRLVRIGLDWLVPSYPPPTPKSLVVLTHRVLDLYRADFLVQEEPQPWTIIARDKLRSQWLRFVTGVGQMLMQTNQLDLAITLYHRALESDPLAEELYRQLMRCYQRAGRHTEAVGVYRRCRDMLSILLGVAPADGTTVIYRECLTHG
jgi:two-component SAPR family response regulator